MKPNSDIGITIIVPVFNAANYLDSCIASVVNQTCRNWQLLLINDGSSDSSGAICNKWAEKDSRIKVFNQENKGPGFARNFGVERAGNNWITFVDADDTIEPEYLSNFHVEELQEGEISIQGFRRMQSDGTLLDEYKDFAPRYYDGAHIADSFSSSWILDFGQTVGKLYYKGFLVENSIKFPTDYRISEDHKFFLSAILKTTGLRLHSGQLYNYIDRNTGNNLTSRKINPEELWRRYQSLKQSYFELINHYEIKDKKVIEWLQYFAFTGSLSIYIQSLAGESSESRGTLIQNLRKEWKYIAKYFKPKSFRGYVVKIMITYLPVKVLDTLLP